MIFSIWPLTYDLDLQSQPSQGQGRPPYQKSRSKVKRFSRERSDRRTDATKYIISLASRSIIIMNERRYRRKRFPRQLHIDCYCGEIASPRFNTIDMLLKEFYGHLCNYGT